MLVAPFREAHARGLRTYAMFCPLLPKIGDCQRSVDWLVRLARECGAEEIFVEPFNPRGNGLKLTQEALNKQGYHAEAAAIGRIRREADWSLYVTDLIKHFQQSARKDHDIRKLRILLYSSGLSPTDAAAIRRDDAGVIWLGKDPHPTVELTHASH